MNSSTDVFNRSLFFLKRVKIFPLVFQVAIFIAFCLLMYSLAVPEYLKSLNTGMLVIWNVWWPLIPFLIFFSGRLWCTVCPFSATANILNKLFPYRIISNRFLLDHRFIIGLLSFMVILSLDNIFSIAANQYYTFLLQFRQFISWEFR